MSELRYHPFLGQWVITATHRQERTFHPPPDFCPLCPTKPGGFPTEIPRAEYDIAVFENRFPSLSPNPPEPAIEGSALMPVRPSEGVCEVVCYSQDHDATFATLPLSQIRKLVRVWKERYVELAARPEVEYVFIFENKGKEIGVTLSHPHGQIYAYPFIPPTMEIELANERRHFETTGRPLTQDWLEEELKQDSPPAGRKGPPTARGGQDGTSSNSRVIFDNGRFVAVVPFFARWPYEVWVAPRAHLRSLAQMEPQDLDALAEALHAVAQAYDRLFGFSMPYILAMKQEPAVAGYPFSWFRAEFTPPYRTETKLKYLAGSEAAAGAFINDTLAEKSADTLTA